MFARLCAVFCLLALPFLLWAGIIYVVMNTDFIALLVVIHCGIMVAGFGFTGLLDRKHLRFDYWQVAIMCIFWELTLIYQAIKK